MRPKWPESSFRPTIIASPCTRLNACAATQLADQMLPSPPKRKRDINQQLIVLVVRARRPFLLLDIDRWRLVRLVDDIRLGLAIDHRLIQHHLPRAR